MYMTDTDILACVCVSVCPFNHKNMTKCRCLSLFAYLLSVPVGVNSLAHVEGESRFGIAHTDIGRSVSLRWSMLRAVAFHVHLIRGLITLSDNRRAASTIAIHWISHRGPGFPLFSTF